MADVEAAGITSTGDTGPNVPNELPSVVADYRRFEADPDRFAEHMAERLEEELFSSGSEPPES
jgi:type I restriction enzyme M protein